MYREGAVTDPMCQKQFEKFCAGDFLLDDTPWLGRTVEVDSNQIDINWERLTLYQARNSQHTQNIQINKVIGENEKCVFYLMEKIYIWTS